MSEAPVRTWEDDNKICLMAALGEVRATLAKLVLPPDAQNVGVASTQATTVHENARSALDCGGSTPPLSSPSPVSQGGVEPPQSKVLSAQSLFMAREATPLQVNVEELRASMAAPPALDTLCATFGLSSFERKILLMCAGAELDSRFASLYAAAHKDARQLLPTFSLALAAFEDAHWSALLPAQPLRYWRLLEMLPGDTLTTSPLRIDERILHFLAGASSIDERLRALTNPLSASSELPMSQGAVVERVAGVWSRSSGQSPWPVAQLCGSDVAGKRAVAATACALLGLHLRVISSQVVPRAPADLELFIRLWERESALDPSGLLVECDDAEAADAQGEAALKRLVESLQSPLLISTREPFKPVERRVLSFEVPAATSAEQLQIWKEALGAAAVALDGRVEALVTQFSLSAGNIHSAVAQALPPSDDGAGLSPAATESGTTLACPRFGRPIGRGLVGRLPHSGAAAPGGIGAAH